MRRDGATLLLLLFGAACATEKEKGFIW